MPESSNDGSTNSVPKQAFRPFVLSLSIKDKAALHASYLPFLKNGGLFVPSNRETRIGDEIFLVLDLMDEPERKTIAGTVAWITPAGANQGKMQGIGVHFPDDEVSEHLRAVIEKTLGSDLHNGKATHTL